MRSGAWHIAALALVLLALPPPAGASLQGRWLGTGTNQDASGNGQTAVFGTTVMFDFDGNFGNIPSALFSTNNDGANSWINFNLSTLWYNLTQLTLMGYVQETGCTAPCNEPLIVLSNATNRDLEMLALGNVTSNVTNVTYSSQLIYVQRRDMGSRVYECRWGTVGDNRTGWNHVAVSRTMTNVTLYKGSVAMPMVLDTVSWLNVKAGLYTCPLPNIGVSFGQLGSLNRMNGTQLLAASAAGAAASPPIGVASAYVGGLAHPVQQRLFDWRFYNNSLWGSDIAQELTHTPTPTPTTTSTATPTATATATHTATATVTHTPTLTATRTRTASRTWTLTGTRTGTDTQTVIPTRTLSPTATRTTTDTPTASTTRSATDTRSWSMTPTRTATLSSTVTGTHTPTATHSATSTATATTTSTASPTSTASSSSTSTVIPTATPTPTASNTGTLTSTASPTATFTLSATPTTSATTTHTSTVTPTLTGTITSSASATLTRTTTITRSVTGTPTATRTGACLPLIGDCYLCANGVPCDDGNPLTYDDKCLNMRCLGSAGDNFTNSSDGMRFFEVTIRVERSFKYQEFTNIVWAVFDRSIGLSFVREGDNASAGLRQFTQTGQADLLLAELDVLNQTGYIKDYGLALPAIRPARVDLIGTEYNFPVAATVNDNLMFAGALIRSNDRFVAPFNGGIPMFLGTTPNYGEQKDFTLWDSGTELDQVYFADLYLGQQSSQQGGGINPGPQQTVPMRPLQPAEYLPIYPFNVSYPKPVEFVHVYFNPGMDVQLASSVRAQQGVTIMTDLTLEAGAPMGNEIALTFPEGFRFNQGGPTVGNVTWWGWEQWANVSGGDNWKEFAQFGTPATFLDVQSRTVYLRWPENTTLAPNHNQRVAVLVYNITNPNNCNYGTWYLRTRQCYMKDLNNAGVFAVRECGPDLYSIRYRGTTGAPSGCTRCNACAFLYTSPVGVDVFSCEDSGRQFLRERPAGLPVFENYYSGGDYTGACAP
eukprot:EG_transcript_1680